MPTVIRAAPADEAMATGLKCRISDIAGSICLASFDATVGSLSQNGVVVHRLVEVGYAEAVRTMRLACADMIAMPSTQ